MSGSAGLHYGLKEIGRDGAINPLLDNSIEPGPGGVIDLSGTIGLGIYVIKHIIGTCLNVE